MSARLGTVLKQGRWSSEISLIISDFEGIHMIFEDSVCFWHDAAILRLRWEEGG